jgi:tRNA A-37 threonylcarbamoyl transferase component Bud32
MIDSIFHIEGWQDVKIIEHYKSKKNLVYKVQNINPEPQNYRVLKMFRGDNAFKRCEAERRNIEYLLQNDVKVPGIIYSSKDTLVMEYINGRLVNDIVEKLEKGEWIEGLAYWLARFHSLKIKGSPVLLGDSNLRNFIYSNGQIYGIDFEEMSTGDYREDIAQICFFMLTNIPCYGKEKDYLVRMFLNEYEGISGERLLDMPQFILKCSRSIMDRRRKLHPYSL